jgi:tRNA A37 methylthiotransferase MiaB
MGNCGGTAGEGLERFGKRDKRKGIDFVHLRSGPAHRCRYCRIIEGRGEGGRRGFGGGLGVYIT